MFKKRTGTLKATDGTGRHFTWTIPKFDTYQPGKTLDSENVVCFTKVKYHFHMSLGSSGDIGLYIHYKAPPIPKYSYCFTNTDGEVMRQHTAHTIPADTERCGHWNVCNHKDMLQFLKEDMTLVIHFTFDDDDITIKRLPEDNLISVMWTIPNLAQQNLNPFSSRGFFIDNTLLVARIDNKRANTSAGGAVRYDHDDIETFVFFLFCRKGKIPPHSIELLDSSGRMYTKVDKKDDGNAQTLMISKAEVDKHLGVDGVLFIKIDLFTGGNPLEALNMLSMGGGGMGAGNGPDSPTGAGPRQVQLGDKKETYDVMDD